MATYSLPSRSSNCCEDGVLKCPETTCGDCGCDEINKYWYEEYENGNYVWKQYDIMYLYGTRCGSCPSTLDYYGNCVTSPCQALFTNPITLDWDSGACGYKSSDSKYLYKHAAGLSQYQPANYFSLHLSVAAGVRQEWFPFYANSDNRFIDPAYEYTPDYWRYTFGGDTVVLITGNADTHLDYTGNNPSNNAAVQCPNTLGTYDYNQSC